MRQAVEPTPKSSGVFSWWRVLCDALSGKAYDYTQGSLTRAVILLAIPMVLETSMESLFAICDIFWVSKLGEQAMAAVGLTESVTTLYYAIAIGLSLAATAMIARRVGEKNQAQAAEAGVQAIYIGVLLGVLTGVVCWFGAPKILAIMGASQEVWEMGTPYMRIVLGCNVVILMLFLNNAIFRGAGDPAIAMRALWIGNGINLVLDPCLIFGWGPFPELGLTGAAIATVIGRGCAVLYQFRELRRGTSQIRLTGAVWRWRPALMLRLVRVAIGGMGQLLIATTSWVALMRIMAIFGDAALAGYTIAIRIVIFTILPSWGLANAASTLVGQSLGAKLPDRAKHAVLLTGVYNMTFLVAAVMVYWIFGEQLMMMFTQDSTSIEIGKRCLHIISYGYVLYGWAMVLTQAFNGAGDTATPTLLNFLACYCVQLPLAWILSQTLRMGPDGVFWAVMVSDALLMVLAWVAFYRGGWMNRDI